jgi:hypothetical protein
MFIISIPKHHKIGDTVDCNINGDPAKLTWRDKDTLVIEPDEAHPIITEYVEGDLRSFTCGNAGETKDSYGVEMIDGGGFVVSGRMKP